MTPDWQSDDGAIQLYHADCRDVLPHVKGIDAVTITDPPFNVGYDYASYSDSMDEDEYWAWLAEVCRWPVCLIHYPQQVFKFAFQVGEFPDNCLAWVYHANTPRQWRMAAWFGVTPDFSAVKQPYRNAGDRRIQRLMANGSTGSDSYNWMLCEQVKNVSSDKTEHPCQMPLEVMERIVGVTPCETVIDPFLGSGTTGVACVKTGRKFIGVEIDEGYFNIAVKRIKAALNATPLFDKPKVKQGKLI
jgi:site-specific DNA-methyltransferase (adenine-specific)